MTSLPYIHTYGTVNKTQVSDPGLLDYLVGYVSVPVMMSRYFTVLLSVCP